MADPKDTQLAVLMSSQLRAALEHAAARRFTSVSEYMRQSAVEKMRADGVEPTQIQSAALEGA